MKIDEVMTFKVRKKIKPPKETPAHLKARRKRKVYYAVVCGDYDPENITHKIFVPQLIREGYLDEELNVLQEYI